MKKSTAAVWLFMMLCMLATYASAQFDLSLFEGEESVYGALFGEVSRYDDGSALITVDCSSADIAFEHEKCSENYYSFIVPQIELTFAGTRYEIPNFILMIVNSMDGDVFQTHTVSVMIGGDEHIFDVSAKVETLPYDEHSIGEFISLDGDPAVLRMMDRWHQAVTENTEIRMKLTGSNGSAEFEVPYLTKLVAAVAYKAYIEGSGIDVDRIRDVHVDPDGELARKGLLSADPSMLNGKMLYIPEMDAAVSIPAGGFAFFKDMPEDASELARYGVSSDEMTQMLEQLNCDYFMIGFSDVLECRIMLTDNHGMVFSSFTQAEADEYIDGVESGLRKADVQPQGSAFFDTPYARLLRIPNAFEIDGVRNNAVMYYIQYGDQMLVLLVEKPGIDVYGEMSQQEYALADAIAATVRFGERAHMERLFLSTERYRIPEERFSCEIDVPSMWYLSSAPERMNGVAAAKFKSYGYSGAEFSYSCLDLSRELQDMGENPDIWKDAFSSHERLKELYGQMIGGFGFLKVADEGFETINGVEYYYTDGVADSVYEGNQPGIMSVAFYCDPKRGVVHMFTLCARDEAEWEEHAMTARAVIERARYPQ